MCYAGSQSAATKERTGVCRLAVQCLQRVLDLNRRKKNPPKFEFVQCLQITVISSCQIESRSIQLLIRPLPSNSALGASSPHLQDTWMDTYRTPGSMVILLQDHPAPRSSEIILRDCHQTSRHRWRVARLPEPPLGVVP